MIKYMNAGLLVLLLQTVSMAGPTAQELLAKFTETADKSHTSFITKSKIKVLMETNYSDREWEHLSGKKNKYYSIEFRTDGEKVKRIQYRWGDVLGPNGDIFFRPESEKIYLSDTYDGEEGYKYSRRHDDPGSVILKSRSWKDFTVDGLLANRDPVSGCFGYLRGDFVRFDSILEKAGLGRVTVRNKLEDLDGTAHYVIDAKTNRGNYTIWLNPEKGYNFSKATVFREAGDFFMKDAKLDSRQKYIFSVENTQFTEIDGVWVPVKGKVKVHYTAPTNELNTIADVKLTSILIDPDHDALDSFSIDDIKDGARVHFVDGAPGKYIWRDGKAVADVDKLVISELDKMAEEIMAEAKVPACAVSKKDGGSDLSLSSLSVSDLLKKYQEAQDKLQSFIAKGKSAIEKNNRKEETTSEFRFDGDRVSHRIHFQDTASPYKIFLWDGKTFIEYIQAGRSKNNRAFIAKNDGRKKEMIAAEYKGAPLMGICAGDYERIDSVLGKAETISLRIQTEQIEKAECYVIDAVTKRGKYTLWLDPQHGYNIAKIEVQRKKGDLIGDMKSLTTDMLFSLKNVRFEQIDAVWVPIEADMQQTGGSQGKTTKWHHKRTEMVLNPDHNTLGSFVADDIPDGTKVIFPGRFDKTTYVWQDGKPVAQENKDVKR